MYAYLKGIIEEVSNDNLVIDVHDVGYNVRISAGTAQMLPHVGEEIKIYTYTQKVLVAQGVKFNSEFYVGMTIDRNTKSVLFMASAEGGV